MSDTPFIIPAGLVLAQLEDGLSVEYAGDIELHSMLGGAIARLSSTGGDVILHIPLEVGTIEAAGQVRSSSKLTVVDLIAGSANIDGDLQLTNGRVDADLTCGGALQASRLAAGSVTCQTLTTDQLETTGDVQTSGDAHLGRMTGSSLSCGGDLQSDELTLNSDLAALGDVDVETLRADDMTIGGHARIGSCTLDGGGSIAGGAILGRVQAEGPFEVAEDLQANHLSTGSLKVGGKLQAQTLETGDATIKGDVEATQINAETLQVDGEFNAERVHASALTVGADARLPQVTISGAVDVRGSLDTGELHVASLLVGGALTATLVVASGPLELGGDVAVDRLEGSKITARGGRLTAKVIIASQSVDIGAIPVRADIVMAPLVRLDPDTSGRISVVESDTDIDGSKVKGCLSLEDVEDLFGNAEQFLADRGVTRTGAIVSPAAADSDDPSEGEQTLDEPLYDHRAHSGDSEPEVLLEVQDSDLGLDSEYSELADLEELGHVESLHELTELEEIEPLEADDDSDDDQFDSGELSPTNGPASIQIKVGAENNRTDARGADNGHEMSDSSSDSDGDGEDDPFGWADQMLTEVVAEGAINHPDAEEEDQTGPVAANSASGSHDAAESESSDMVSALGAPESSDDAEDAAQADSAEQAGDHQPVDTDPIHERMQTTVARIVTCYTEPDLPPAVVRLRDLVGAHDYATIRSDITDIWNQLLRFHQKRGLRIQPQVTTTFNTINSLVRKL